MFDSILGRTNSHSSGRPGTQERPAVDLGVVEWSASLTVEAWSSSAVRLTGWPAALRIGRPLLSAPMVEDGPDGAHARRLQRLLSSRESGELVREAIQRPDGRRLQLEWRHEVHRDGSGAVTGGFSLLRCHADFAKESLSALFEAQRPALVLLRPGGALIRINGAAAALLELPAGVCEDVELTALVAESDRAHLERVLDPRRHEQCGRPFTGHFRCGARSRRLNWQIRSEPGDGCWPAIVESGRRAGRRTTRVVRNVTLASLLPEVLIVEASGNIRDSSSGDLPSGTNLFDVLRQADGQDRGDAMAVAGLLQEVLGGHRKAARREWEHFFRGARERTLVRISSFPRDGEPLALIACETIRVSELAARRRQELGHQLERVFLNADRALAILDLDGLILKSNEAFGRAVGAIGEQLAGARPTDFLAPIDDEAPLPVPRELVRRCERQCVRTVRVARAEPEAPARPARLRLVDDEESRPSYGMLELLEPDADVAAIDRLRSLEGRFRRAFEACPVPMALLDSAGRFRRLNSAMARCFGRSTEWLRDRPLSPLLELVDRAPTTQTMEALAGGDCEHVVRDARLCLDEGEVPVRLNLSAVSRETRRFEIFLMIEAPGAPFGRAGLSNRAGRTAGTLALAAERERRRLAAELHDRPLQVLAASRMVVAGLLQRGASEPPVVEKGLARLDRMLAEITRETRNLVYELAPPGLTDRSLEDALEGLVSSMRREPGPELQFELTGEVPELGSDRILILYQCVRELLSNAVRHAEAGRIVVTLRGLTGAVEASVEDDGQGFDTAALSHPDESGGYGLLSVRERLAAVGGHLVVRASPSRGAHIIMHLVASEGAAGSA